MCWACFLQSVTCIISKKSSLHGQNTWNRNIFLIIKYDYGLYVYEIHDMNLIERYTIIFLHLHIEGLDECYSRRDWRGHLLDPSTI